MQFSNEDDASDFDLNAGARSRLSSLFQAEGKKGDVNQALMFTAPKQPKKTDPAQNNPGEFKLIASGVVNAFKLIDGSYVSQGKLGCAVLGVHHNALYQFLLYKAKRVQVMACKIHPNFKFHVQPNNYVNFYDDRNENWSINFDSDGSLCEIAKQIAIAKANCEGKSPITLVVQDLALGEGPVLDKGDSAEIKYTGWLLSNYSLGQEFDSNMKSESPFRLRLGKSKVIKGWHEGLLGAQKGCKRLLIIPPSLGYGSEGLGTNIPPNSTLIFEVHVVKVKRARELSHSPSPKLPDTTVPDKKPEVTPRSSFSQEDNIKLRGASISEQLTQSPKKDKAQLISRMAKMGTATLPFQGAIPAQVSTSSDEEEVLPESPPVPVTSSRTASPKPSLPRSRNNSGSISGSQSDRTMSIQAETVIAQVSQQPSPLIHSQASLNTQSPYLAPSVVYPGYQRPMDPYQFPHPQFPLQMPSITPSIADTHMPLLITESRTQNAETRLSLSKISDKVDTAIQKIDELRLNQGKSSHTPFLDSSILVQNIERIIQENRQLKEDVESKNAKIQALNDKVHDLFQRNQRFYEENNSILEQKNESSLAQEKLINLEKENAELSAELMDVENKIKTMESELLIYKNQEIEFNHRLVELRSTIGTQSNDSSKDNELIKLQNQLITTEEEKNNIAEKLDSMEKQKENLLQSEKSLKKKIEEMEAQLESTKTAVPATEVNELKISYEKQISSYKDQLKETSSTSSQLLTDAQSSLEGSMKKVLELEAELQKSMLWKQKFESFHQKTRALKESYENRISELTCELQQLQETRTYPVSAEFSGELRKVMNALYRILQGMFESNTSYQGSKVLEMTLQAIKALTLRMLEMKSRASTASSEKELESGVASSEKEAVLEEAKRSSTLKKTGSGDTLRVDESSQLNGVAENICDNEEKASGDSLKIKSVEEESVLSQSGRDSDCKADDKSESDSKSNDNSFNQNIPSDSNTEDISTKNIEEPSQTSDLSKVSNEKKVEIVNRDSPEIWRPQPPPLFDTDEEEDDDSWLK